MPAESHSLWAACIISDRSAGEGYIMLPNLNVCMYVCMYVCMAVNRTFRNESSAVASPAMGHLGNVHSSTSNSFHF